MKISIGNDMAIEGYREYEDGPLKYRKLEGERVTEFIAPDSWNLMEVVDFVRATIPYHMDVSAGGVPKWIECDDEAVGSALRQIFVQHGKEPPKQRPKSWGAQKQASKAKKPTEARATLDITVTTRED